jgi:hypothetical protein
MTNAESITNSEWCGALSPERRDLADIGYAKVERVVPNALRKTAALPPDICAFGDHTPIVFREADPPWANSLYPLTRPDPVTLVGHCFVLRHLVIPSSLDIRLPRRSTAEAGHSSFSRTMCMPRTMVA